MRSLIAANWKMHGLREDGLDRARALVSLSTTPPCDIVVCPPVTLIATLSEVFRGSPVALGGQDCHDAENGAHTGDVSAVMLADLGCRYAIVGHSERRADYGESDAQVRAKAMAAHAAGLVSIVCVGESESQRDEGETLTIVRAQLDGSLPDTLTSANTVVAYEPVWAIGTGRTPTNDEVAEVHGAMRQRLGDRFGDDGNAVRLLYGGSVKPANAKELLAIRAVDGALVGGASLDPDGFWAICESCRGPRLAVGPHPVV